MTVIVRFLDEKWPTEVVAVPKGMTATQVVEKMQRNYAKMGNPTGCKWKVAEGNGIDALIESHGF